MVKPITLTTLNAEASRRRNSAGGGAQIMLDNFQNCSLPGLVEFFLSAMASKEAGANGNWRGSSSEHKLDLMWRYLNHVWTGEVCESLNGGRSAAQDVEFFSLIGGAMMTPNSPDNLRLHEFEARIVSAGKRAGLPSKLSYGLASVVHELIENVFQHSDGDNRRQIKGLGSYHVAQDYFALSVCDLGLGTLNSLRMSPQWTHLKDDRDSLDAVVTRHASRKPSLGDGEGFKTVFKNLVDRNTAIRLRTGSACVRIRGSGLERAAEWHESPYLGGLQVSIVWSALGSPEEKELFQLTQ